jgi:hypothetical protein
MERETNTYRQEWLMPPVLTAIEVDPPHKRIEKAYSVTFEGGVEVATLEFGREWQVLQWELPEEVIYPEKLLRSLKRILAPKEKGISAGIEYFDDRGRVRQSLSAVGKKSTREHREAMHHPSRIKDIQYHADTFRLILKNPAYNKGKGIIKLKIQTDASLTPEMIHWVFAHHPMKDTLSSIDPASAATMLSQLR